MTKCAMMLLAFAVSMQEPCDDALVRNLYRMVDRVYGGEAGTPALSVFRSVRGGDGFDFGSIRRPFLDLVSVVSNSYGTILRSWDGCATNEMVAFTVANAAVRSGDAAHLALADVVISRYERTGQAADWALATYVVCPSLTTRMQFMLLHHDSSAVNALLRRFRACARTREDAQDLAEWCDDVLSGKAREEYLEMKAAGAVE